MSGLPGGAALRRRHTRKYILIGGAVALSAALAHRAYTSDALGRSRRSLARLRAALQSYMDALATGGEIAASLLRDLEQFLASDRDDIPPSLRQVSRLARSEEVTSVASSTVAALYRGIAGPPPEGARGDGGARAPQQGALDKVLESLLSDRGHSLVSVAVSMAAKNAVAAWVDGGGGGGGANRGAASPALPDRLIAFLSTPGGQQLAVMAVAAFASNGMRVYMDSSLDVNFYEDLFSSMAKPQHLEAVKQCVSVLARDVVSTYLQNGSGGGRSRSALMEAARVRDEGEAAAGGRAAPAGGGAGQAPARPAEERAGEASGGAGSCSPASSVGSDAAEAAARWRRQDDLDSDSLLHARQAAGKAGGAPPRHAGQAGNAQWIAAVGREWVNASRDPAGRQAMAAVVGSATREVVAGVSSAVADRLSAAWFLAVLLLGAATAWLAAALLRATAGLLF